MKHKRNLIIGIVLSATAGFIALQSVNAPTPADEVIESPSAIKSESASAEETCYYVWAYRDAYALTERLDTALKAAHPEVEVNATFFGEDCIYPDGRTAFIPMQTDFYLRLPVDSAANETTLGDWMTLGLETIVQLPREEIAGEYGFAEFWFDVKDADSIILHVPIRQYLEEARGLKGADLFRKYRRQP